MAQNLQGKEIFTFTIYNCSQISFWGQLFLDSNPINVTDIYHFCPHCTLYSSSVRLCRIMGALMKMMTQQDGYWKCSFKASLSSKISIISTQEMHSILQETCGSLVKDLLIQFYWGAHPLFIKAMISSMVQLTYELLAVEGLNTVNQLFPVMQ